MDNSPKVSIIIPAFNVEKYIDTMINSIIKQTYKNWELIIVDDGSTDTTYEAIDKFSKQDPRIILIKRNREPKGSLTCRNIGQKIANGKYFIHFDSDDIVEPFCLEQRVNFMERCPELDYATFKGKTVFQNEDGVVYGEGRSWGNKPKRDVLSCFLSTQYPYSVWNNIYRRSSFKNYFWDESIRIYTDFSYIVPSIIEGKNHAFDVSSKPDYLYRIGQGGAMTSSFISQDKYISTKYLFEKTMKQLVKTKDFAQYKKAFCQFYLLQLRRIIENGNLEQLEDFYKFFKSYYPHGKLNAFLAYHVFRSRKRKKMSVDTKALKVLIYLFFSPSTIVKWISSQIGR